MVESNCLKRRARGSVNASVKKKGKGYAGIPSCRKLAKEKKSKSEGKGKEGWTEEVKVGMEVGNEGEGRVGWGKEGTVNGEVHAGVGGGQWGAPRGVFLLRNGRRGGDDVKLNDGAALSVTRWDCWVKGGG